MRELQNPDFDPEELYNNFRIKIPKAFFLWHELREFLYPAINFTDQQIMLELWEKLGYIERKVETKIIEGEAVSLRIIEESWVFKK